MRNIIRAVFFIMSCAFAGTSCTHSMKVSEKERVVAMVDNISEVYCIKQVCEKIKNGDTNILKRNNLERTTDCLMHYKNYLLDLRSMYAKLNYPDVVDIISKKLSELDESGEVFYKKVKGLYSLLQRSQKNSKAVKVVEDSIRNMEYYGFGQELLRASISCGPSPTIIE